MAEPETLGEPIGGGNQFGVHLKPVIPERAAAEGYYVSTSKDEPLIKIQELVGAKLGVAAEGIVLVFEGKKLDPKRGLSENSVVLPGARRRREGVKLELYFDLSMSESIKASAAAEQREHEEEEAKKAAMLEEQKRIQDELEQQRQKQKTEQQERLKKEREDAAARAAAEEAARPAAQRAPAPDAPMPKLNFRRLMAEYRNMQRALANPEQMPWLLKCEPCDDHLLCWEVEITFPEDSPLQKSLEELATDSFDDTKNRVTFQVRFPPEYPAHPPEVWLRRPRLKYMKRRSVGVTFGGKVCNELLVASNWDNSTSMSTILEEIRRSLVDAGAEVDIKVSKKQDYPEAPSRLERLATVKFEKANDFEMQQVTVISAVEAAQFTGDDWTRLEQSDKIVLPQAVANRIYGRVAEGLELDMPLMFEVKTRLGRKQHCTVLEFVDGIPPDHCLMPRWVMDELFIDERDAVQIRGVVLPLCEFVKIQPHSLEFYDAVGKAGGDVQPLLLESIKRFSALTVESSIPVEILGQTYDVLIMDLQPQGAVRVIDQDPLREFEFPVEFVAAPDLDDEDTKKARQNELIARLKAKHAEQEAEQRNLEDKRVEAKVKHFEATRNEAVAAAGADDGQEGDVVIMLRLPSGQSKGRFREGAPVSALVAMALKSDWAAGCKPWGVTMVMMRKEIKEGDVITKDMNGVAVNVREVEAPESDKELFAALPAAGGLTEAPAAGVGGEIELPPIDEEALQRDTQRAFQIQCFIQAGCSREEAVANVDAGAPLPSTAAAAPARAPPLPAARAPAPAPAPARPRPRDVAEAVAQAFEGVPVGQEHLARPPQPGDEHYEEINMVMNVVGCTPYGARMVLEATNWDVQQAVDNLLDMNG